MYVHDESQQKILVKKGFYFYYDFKDKSGFRFMLIFLLSLHESLTYKH